MTLFIKYLKEQKKGIGMLLLFILIFAVIFWQYHLPLLAVAYPSLLCMLAGGIALSIDFRQFQKKHLLLKRLSSLSAEMISELPDCAGLHEEDYQKLIRMLQDEQAQFKADADERYRDMIGYYTLWAHQIKTPIASMRLNLQNEDSALSRRLQAELFRIEQYVEMVLAFLRLGSDSSDYVFEKCELDSLIRQSVRKFSHEFIERKLTLTYEPVGGSIVTDEKWLCFVLEQLLSNALKYTKEGGIRIYKKDEDTLCIEDTGIGIAPQDLPRIFENGYTGYNGRTDKKASGIGLYLTGQVCSRLGIGLHVESELGKGSCVSLYLKQTELKTE